MGILTSKVFTDGDPVVVKRLEDCALGRPNQVMSHFKLGHKGEPVRRLQEALKDIQQREPDLGIPEFSVNGAYDQKFAKAVYRYKEKRNIRNHSNRIDDVVGIKTIISLDRDSTSRPPKVNPAPGPLVFPHKPNVIPRPSRCVPESECPPATVFDVTLLAGASGGEGLEGSLCYFTIRDVENGLSTMYAWAGVGGGFGSPVNVMVGGGPKRIDTSPVRVTRFGPVAKMLGATDPYSTASLTILHLRYIPEGTGLPQSLNPFVIDTGNVSLPGIGGQSSLFGPRTMCDGRRGAIRRVHTLSDVPLPFRK
jgi:hypothetical protein